MKLTFLYQPVGDSAQLKETVAFYRDVLGLDESWREGDTTVAFTLPGTEVELMLDVWPEDADRRTSGFFGVDDVDRFVAEHPEIKWVGEPVDVPGGRTAGFLDPSGNLLRVFDQSAAGPE